MGLHGGALLDFLDRVREKLAQGEGLAGSLRARRWISETSLALISAGEESGKLAEALDQIAQESERGLDAAVLFFLKLLEPAMILLVGAAVGFLVISIMLPIFEINGLAR